MNTSQRNDLLTGIFVLVALGVLFGLTFIIQGSTGMRPYTVKMEFANVSGLEIGSPVLVAGFRSGRVVSMEAKRDTDGRTLVEVTAKVARTIPIFGDATATLVNQGFIGDKRIEIENGTAAKTEIKDGDLIATTPPPDIIAESLKAVAELRGGIESFRKLIEDEKRIAQIDKTIASIEATSANIERSSAEIRDMIKANRDSLEATVANVEKVSDRTVVMSEKADQFLDESQAAIKELRANVEDLTGRVRQVVDKADRVGTSADTLLVTSKDEIVQLSDSLERTSNTLNEILTQVKKGDGTVGMLVNDAQPFEDLRASISQVRNILMPENRKVYDRSVDYRPAPTASPAP